MKLRDILTEIQDDANERLFKLQHDDFLKNINWDDGIDHKDFERYILLKIKPNDVWYQLAYFIEPDKMLNKFYGIQGDKIRYFKTIPKQMAKYPPNVTIYKLEGITPDDVAYPLPKSYDRIVVYCIFKKRFDTFSIYDKKTFLKFKQPYDAGRLTIHSVVGGEKIK